MSLSAWSTALIAAASLVSASIGVKAESTEPPATAIQASSSVQQPLEFEFTKDHLIGSRDCQQLAYPIRIKGDSGDSALMLVLEWGKDGPDLFINDGRSFSLDAPKYCKNSLGLKFNRFDTSETPTGDPKSLLTEIEAAKEAFIKYITKENFPNKEELIKALEGGVEYIGLIQRTILKGMRIDPDALMGPNPTAKTFTANPAATL